MVNTAADENGGGMRDNMDGYGGGGDAGWQQKRCGMKEMANGVRRKATDWENFDRERLPT